jgi:hypothetical protein
MYQHELISIANMKMMQAIRYREGIEQETEAYGYWHGMYKAYEEMTQLLMMTDIRRESPDSPSIAPIV